jgi:hypothetical protein
LGPRFQRTLDRLSQIDPALGDWLVGFNEREQPLPITSSDQFVEAVRECVGRMEGGEPDPQGGYDCHAVTRPTIESRLFMFLMHVGNTIVANYLINSVMLQTKSLCDENASLLTIDVLKPAMFILTSEWKPAWAELTTDHLISLQHTHKPGPPLFGMSWVTYIAPRFVHLITPPASAKNEYLSDGGLLMTATEERFSIHNPRHMAVARDIADALRPVNALRWPLGD